MGFEKNLMLALTVMIMLLLLMVTNNCRAAADADVVVKKSNSTTTTYRCNGGLHGCRRIEEELETEMEREVMELEVSSTIIRILAGEGGGGGNGFTGPTGNPNQPAAQSDCHSTPNYCLPPNNKPHPPPCQNTAGCRSPG